jgi:tetratricopeptide (TPR) repeat protein
MTPPSAFSAIAASISLLLFVLVILQLLRLLWLRSVVAKFSQIAKVRRQWHPRSPDDCPHCSHWVSPAPTNIVEIVPWKATRGPRGAKKRLSSEGVSCPNAECTYFGCTVASIHAAFKSGDLTCLQLIDGYLTRILAYEKRGPEKDKTVALIRSPGIQAWDNWTVPMSMREVEPGVRLISLQKHHGLDQLANLPAGAKVETLGEDFDSGPDAFIDTAAAMSNLDLIITADTSTAHLAGALGCPTWVALKYVPDWRWLLDRNDSPWYPTMRLFRQETPGDWKLVFSTIEQELRSLLGSPDPIGGAISAVPSVPEEALSLHQEGKLGEASALYRKILAQNPNRADALHLLGVVEFQTRNPSAAIELIERAIQIEPNNAAFYSNLGLVLADLRRLDDALAIYDRALALQPDFADALNNRGLVLQELNRFHDALGSYDRALALQPDYADALYNRGNLLSDLKHFEEALASYDRVLALLPDFAEALNNRGNALRELKRFDDAVASYDRALALKPDFAEALNDRGLALQDLKRFDDALASYDRALAVKERRGGAVQASLLRGEEMTA